MFPLMSDLTGPNAVGPKTSTKDTIIIHDILQNTLFSFAFQCLLQN